MEEIKAFYESNMDFKEYVDRYAKKHATTVEKAFESIMVRDVYYYYKHNI